MSQTLSVMATNSARRTRTPDIRLPLAFQTGVKGANLPLDDICRMDWISVISVPAPLLASLPSTSSPTRNIDAGMGCLWTEAKTRWSFDTSKTPESVQHHKRMFWMHWRLRGHFSTLGAPRVHTDCWGDASNARSREHSLHHHLRPRQNLRS